MRVFFPALAIFFVSTLFAAENKMDIEDLRRMYDNKINIINSYNSIVDKENYGTSTQKRKNIFMLHIEFINSQDTFNVPFDLEDRERRLSSMRGAFGYKKTFVDRWDFSLFPFVLFDGLGFIDDSGRDSTIQNNFMDLMLGSKINFKNIEIVPAFVFSKTPETTIVNNEKLYKAENEESDKLKMKSYMIKGRAGDFGFDFIFNRESFDNIAFSNNFSFGKMGIVAPELRYLSYGNDVKIGASYTNRISNGGVIFYPFAQIFFDTEGSGVDHAIIKIETNLAEGELTSEDWQRTTQGAIGFTAAGSYSQYMLNEGVLGFMFKGFARINELNIEAGFSKDYHEIMEFLPAPATTLFFTFGLKI